METMQILRYGNGRFRLTGTPTDPQWAASVRAGREPWCEFVISGNYVTSYGGEVWPTAWPEYFQPIPASVQFGCGGIKLTPAGAELLREN